MPRRERNRPSGKGRAGARGRDRGGAPSRGGRRGQGHQLRRRRRTMVSGRRTNRRGCTSLVPPDAPRVSRSADRVTAVWELARRVKNNRVVHPDAAETPLAVHVDQEACTLCGVCQTVCPTGAIELGDTAAEVNVDACALCGACVEACPTGAIAMN